MADQARAGRFTWAGHLAILRIDHWFKNVFVLPGLVAAIAVDPSAFRPVGEGAWRLVLGMASICLVASSNYVINEVLDAPYDRSHPEKSRRPVPAGLVSVPVAVGQWLALMVLGIALGHAVSPAFAATMAALWGMGCLYNIPPVRTKEVPYVDVLSESINNPIRLVAGWTISGTAAIAPLSLLLSYWMLGAYFMALKRFAELRSIGDRERAAAYRRSFATYTVDSLLVSSVFYVFTSMLFMGAFIMRYRLELILSFPLIALILALYLRIALRDDSPVQRPEALYRETALMLALVVCAAVMAGCMLVDLPWMHRVFAPRAPAQ